MEKHGRAVDGGPAPQCRMRLEAGALLGLAAFDPLPSEQRCPAYLGDGRQHGDAGRPGGGVGGCRAGPSFDGEVTQQPVRDGQPHTVANDHKDGCDRRDRRRDAFEQELDRNEPLVVDGLGSAPCCEQLGEGTSKPAPVGVDRLALRAVYLGECRQRVALGNKGTSVIEPCPIGHVRDDRVGERAREGGWWRRTPTRDLRGGSGRVDTSAAPDSNLVDFDRVQRARGPFDITRDERARQATEAQLEAVGQPVGELGELRDTGIHQRLVGAVDNDSDRRMLLQHRPRGGRPTGSSPGIDRVAAEETLQPRAADTLRRCERGILCRRPQRFGNDAERDEVAAVANGDAIEENLRWTQTVEPTLGQARTMFDGEVFNRTRFARVVTELEQVDDVGRRGHSGQAIGLPDGPRQVETEYAIDGSFVGPSARWCDHDQVVDEPTLSHEQWVDRRGAKQCHDGAERVDGEDPSFDASRQQIGAEVAFGARREHREHRRSIAAVAHEIGDGGADSKRRRTHDDPERRLTVDHVDAVPDRLGAHRDHSAPVAGAVDSRDQRAKLRNFKRRHRPRTR